MSSSLHNIRLHVPHQDLEQSSFFALDEKSVSTWVGQLPKANIGQTTRLLYQAIKEFNRVRLLPAKRLAILELLRPAIYQVSRALAKHYLNQPIILPEQSAKVAELADSLHYHLAQGYATVAAHAAALGSRAGIPKPVEVIAPALHRAITDISLNMLRHYQLYEQVNENSWLQVNQYYLLARQHKAHTRLIQDVEYGDCSVEESYIRTVLMGCAKPNQLRQEDMLNIFEPLIGWSRMCRLGHAGEQALFAVDPSGDNAPVYHSLVESIVDERWLGLDTSQLVTYLRQLREQAGNALRVQEDKQLISTDLVGHLTLAWSQMSKRVFMRLESDDELDLSLGLSTTHHFVSGEISFEALTDERGAKTFTTQQENPFLKSQGQVAHRQKDIWDSAYDKNLGQTQVALESIDYHIKQNEQQSTDHKSKYCSHQVRSLNSSAHGYCIEWPKEVAAQVKAGEIVGIKDVGRHNWSIGVIRWVNHDHEHSTQIGIELISPSASPYGAKVVQKTGESTDFARVLILPEIKSINRPYTLLTPRLPFREGQKVILNQRGKEIQIQLTKKLNATGAYNLFEFRKGGLLAQKTGQIKAPSGDENPFDSLWGQL